MAALSKMDCFYILANKEKDINLEKSKAITQFLELRGKKCGYQEIERVYDDESRIAEVVAKIPEDTDVVIVLGGDGTIIQAAGMLSNHNISIMGVNMGTLGFLAEVEKDNVFDALDKVLQGNFDLEERMMISGEATVSGIKLKHVHALNDVVITRNGALRVARFNVYVNDKLLYSVDADGYVISTPTGSTAYSLSAGGPIVAPYAESIIITPVCGHSINLRPIVLSKDDEVRVELSPDERNSSARVEVSFDGGKACPLNPGDYVTVKKSYSKTRIIKLSTASFFDVLSKKMTDN